MTPKQPILPKDLIDGLERLLRNRQCREYDVSTVRQYLSEKLAGMAIVPFASNAETRRMLGIDERGEG